MGGKRLLSMREACRYLGMSRMTLIDAEERGLIKPERTAGGHRRYTVAALRELLETTRAQHEAHQFAAPSHDSFQLAQCITRLRDRSLTPEHTLKEALRNLVLLLHIEIGAVFLLDETQRLSLRASYGVPHGMLTDIAYLDSCDVSAQVLRVGRPIVYDQSAQRNLPARLEIGQGLCVPLVYQDETLGVLHVISSHRYQFFPSEINIVSTIAVYLASLVVNAQLLAQVQTRLRELALLNRLSNLTETCTELDLLLHAFLNEVLKLIGVEYGTVFLRDRSAQRLYIRAARGYPDWIYDLNIAVDEGIAGWVMQHAQPRYSPNLPDEPLLPQQFRDIARTVGSSLCLPLRTNNEIVGVFHVTAATRREFSPDEVRVLLTAGNQAAVVIHRALLLEEIAQRAHHSSDERTA